MDFVRKGHLTNQSTYLTAGKSGVGEYSGRN